MDRPPVLRPRARHLGSARHGLWVLGWPVGNHSQHGLQPAQHVEARGDRGAHVGLVAPALCLGVGLWRIYSDPVVFALDPFFGYFAGPIYDEGIAIAGRYLWFRIYNLLAATSALLAIDLFIGKNLHLQPLARARAAPWTVLVWLAATASAANFGLRPTAHGFHTTVASLSEALPGHYNSPHFVIHYAPHSPTARDIELVAAEHEFAWHRLATTLGASPPAPIHSFVFPSPQHKRALIGAGNTEVAPPWRGHLYLNEQPFPHRVLHHELAHAFSYAFGDRIFGAPARMSATGPRVNLALLEGFATALAPRAESGLDLHDQAAILHTLELRPPLASIMGLGFWGNASRRAYTAAGSFSLWLIETHGVPAFTQLYRSAGDFHGVYGVQLDALESAWVAFLATRPLEDADVERLRQRYMQRPIFQRPCAHRAADLLAAAQKAQLRGDHDERLAALQDLCSVEPTRPEHRLTLALAQAQAGQPTEAAATLDAIANLEERSDTILALLDERRGDLALARSDLPGAAAAYQLALTRGVAEAQVRSLQLKLEACADPSLAPLVLAYFDPFAQHPDHPHQPVLRLYAALQITKLPSHAALGDYLVARQLLNVGHAEAARDHATRALDPAVPVSALPSHELRRGAQWMLLEAHLRLRDYSAARRLVGNLEVDPQLRSGDRLELDQWRQRIEFYAEFLP